MSKDSDSLSIFQAIRSAVDLKTYCVNNGIHFHRSGMDYRALSPFTQAKNAFRISTNNPECWHDYSLIKEKETGTHGDVITFSALWNHDGDIRKALHELVELMPPAERKKYAGEIDRYLQDREYVQHTVEHAHDLLISDRYDLSAHWIPYLHLRGLDDEQIRRLKLGVDSMNELRLLIPRFNYDGKEVLYYNTRRMPDKEGHERENEPKYKMAEKGVNTFLRNVPFGLPTLNRKSSFLILTEGDFDAINFEREGYAVVGKFSGDFWPEILCRAENFDAVALAYDNDDTGRGFTKSAAEKLFERNIPFRVVELPHDCKDVNDYYRTGRSLQALVAEAIPGLEYLAGTFIPQEAFEDLSRGKKKEYRDNLKAFLIRVIRNGADKPTVIELCTFLTEHYSPKWIDEVIKLAEKGECEFDTVEHIRKTHTLMYNERTGFYEYDENSGIWIARSDKAVGAMVKAYLGHSSSAKKIHNITEHLKSAVFDTAPVEFFDVLPLFAFRNGTIPIVGEAQRRVRQGNNASALFRPSSEADYVTRRLNYDYEATARPKPETLEAIAVIFGHDQRRIDCFQEFGGYCLMPHCRYQMALILRNMDRRGSNGKSTILEVLRAVLGYENTTSLEPAQFADAHALIQLKGAKANICTDANPNMAGGEINLQKAITGDKDTLRGRYLFRDFIEFHNTAKIIFAVNGDFTFKNGAMQRRFLVIDCVARFVDGEPEEGTNEVKADKGMTEKLMKDLPGLFNWFHEGAKRLIRNGGRFTQTEEQATLTAMFESATDSVQAFVDECSADFYDDENFGRAIERGVMYRMYCDFCNERGCETLASDRKFHGAFKAALHTAGIKYREYRPHGKATLYDFATREQLEQDVEQDN